MARWCAGCQERHRTCAICHASHATTQLCDHCRKDPANKDWIEQDEAVALEYLDSASRLDTLPDMTLQVRTLADLQGQRPIREPGQKEQQILYLVHNARVRVGVRRYRAPRHHEIAAVVGCSRWYVGKVLQKILK